MAVFYQDFEAIGNWRLNINIPEFIREKLKEIWHFHEKGIVTDEFAAGDLSVIHEVKKVFPYVSREERLTCTRQLSLKKMERCVRQGRDPCLAAEILKSSSIFIPPDPLKGAYSYFFPEIADSGINRGYIERLLANKIKQLEKRIETDNDSEDKEEVKFLRAGIIIGETYLLPIDYLSSLEGIDAKSNRAKIFIEYKAGIGRIEIFLKKVKFIKD